MLDLLEDVLPRTAATTSEPIVNALYSKNICETNSI